jgi:hypothetical protein
LKLHHECRLHHPTPIHYSPEIAILGLHSFFLRPLKSNPLVSMNFSISRFRMILTVRLTERTFGFYAATEAPAETFRRVSIRGKREKSKNASAQVFGSLATRERVMQMWIALALLGWPMFSFAERLVQISPEVEPGFLGVLTVQVARSGPMVAFSGGFGPTEGQALESVYAVEPGAEPSRRLTPSRPWQTQIRTWRITPDGARIAVVGNFDQAFVNEVFGARTDGSNGLVRLDSRTKTSGNYEVFNDISVNNERAIFLASVETAGVQNQALSLALDGGQLRFLGVPPPSGGALVQLRMSGDGRKVAYFRNTINGGPLALRLAMVDTEFSEETVSTAGAGEIGEMAFTPDSARFLYTRATALGDVNKSLFSRPLDPVLGAEIRVNPIPASSETRGVNRLIAASSNRVLYAIERVSNPNLVNPPPPETEFFSANPAQALNHQVVASASEVLSTKIGQVSLAPDGVHYLFRQRSSTIDLLDTLQWAPVGQPANRSGVGAAFQIEQVEFAANQRVVFDGRAQAGSAKKDVFVGLRGANYASPVRQLTNMAGRSGTLTNWRVTPDGEAVIFTVEVADSVFPSIKHSSIWIVRDLDLAVGTAPELIGLLPEDDTGGVRSIMFNGAGQALILGRNLYAVLPDEDLVLSEPFTFTSFIEAPNPSNESAVGLGGWVRARVTTNGRLTGTLYLGAKRYAFRATVDQSDTTVIKAENILITVDKRDPSKNILMNLAFRAESHTTLAGLTGTLAPVAGGSHPIGPGWRHVWHSRKNPAFGGRNRTLNVSLLSFSGSGPQGYGFAAIKLNTGGLARWAARLADGSRVTGSFVASPLDEIPLYSRLRYAKGGSIYALFGLEMIGQQYKTTISGAPDGRWIKNSVGGLLRPDRMLPGGFATNLNIHGAEFVKPARGETLFGNSVGTLSLNFTLAGEGILFSSSQLGSQDPISLASAIHPGNKLTVTEILPVRFPASFTTANGLLRGQVVLRDSDLLGGIRPITRTLAYQGLYIPDLNDPAGSAIRGFFLLPELPDMVGEKPNTTPITSGRILIER